MPRAPMALLLALLAAAARAQEGAWELAAELGGGQDTNPERLFGSARPAPEGFASALARARATLQGERFRLSGRLTGAGRLYPGRPDASATACGLEGDVRRDLGGPAAAVVELDASGLAERDHRLDQRALRTQAGLRLEAGPWSGSLTGGWGLFQPLAAELRPLRASGPEGWLRARWAPARAHALSAGLGLWSPASPSPPGERDRRRDETLTAAAEYAWRGPLLASLAYAWSSNHSSVPGGAFERHRVTGRGAAFLPFDLSLALRVSLQWTRYAAPLQLPEQLLAGGGETQDAVEARLTAPLGGPWELALAGAWYWSEAVSGGSAPAFSRAVTSLALGWRRRSPEP